MVWTTNEEGIPIKIIGGLPHGGDSAKILHAIMEEIKDFVARWQEQLTVVPGECRRMEWEALRLCTRIAGLIIALVLADRRVGEAAAHEGLQARPDRVRSPRPVKRRVLLPGGVKVQVQTPYCAPKMGRAASGKRRQGEGAGVYPAFAALGIFEGKSPLAADLLLRFALQMPSFETARQELETLGHPYDSKMPARTVRDFGKQALESRNAQLAAWHRGELGPEKTLAGRRVVVSADGGRLRIRRKRKRARSGKRRKYIAEWREPKLITIYALDERGRRDPEVKVQIDATMAGPDETMELLAFHLFRLGAGEASVIEFIADGAPWIWERIDKVIAWAGLDPKRCRKVLDIYHAYEHLGAALEACGLVDREKKRQFSRLKNKLRVGKAGDMLLTLQGYLGRRRTKVHLLQKEIEYFRKRLPLLRYDEIKRKRLALGSGAVESAIRRVINMRVKSPSMFWDEDTAEAMIHMRAQLLSDRWDEMMDRIREHAKVSRRRIIAFTPTTCQPEAAAA